MNEHQLQLDRENFIQSLQLILDPHDLHINNLESKHAEKNTLSMNQQILGLGYPRNIEQVQLILKLALSLKIAVYPVSQGKNVGYGEMTPLGQNQFVIGLKYLNSIREYDSKNGEVVVEPGVTQKQLSKYLSDQNAPFWADVTGASPDASLIGNTLESGFGHTPIGDHRKHILQMEVMLTNGSILKTVEMPAIGPDLSQLFVQSNFGLVLSMRIPLYPIPEKTVTFTIAFQSDKEFLAGVSVLSDLRKNGTISSLTHTGNSTRALMTSSRFPESHDPKCVLTEQDCHQILNARSPIDFGLWASVGGLYGFKNEVKSKQRRVKKAFKGIAKVQFFSDEKVHRIHSLLNSKLAMKFRYLDFIRGSFSSLKALHGIIRGQPSPHPSENIFWRVHKFENLGLIWHAPVIPATAKDVQALMETSRFIFHKYRLEMPVTLTLIDAKHMTSVFNFSFDKLNPEETQRARSAYTEFSAATTKLGYMPYRCGIASHPTSYYNKEQFEFLQKLKKSLDPENIMAPGRYGLG